MARLKTAYRPKSEATELDSAEAINSNAELPADCLLPDEDSLQREPGSPPEPQAAQPEAPPQESDASSVLRGQVEALHRSETIAKQRHAAAAAEQRRINWLRDTPAAQVNYNALAGLHDQAMRAGLDDLSPEYFAHMESGLEALEPQQNVEAESMSVERPAAPAPAQTPTPDFFRPTAPKMPSPRAALVSAPVSRSIPTADRDRETNPNRVKLSPSQREAAKIAGVDELTYAKGLIAIEREKAEGRRQG